MAAMGTHSHESSGIVSSAEGDIRDADSINHVSCEGRTSTVNMAMAEEISAAPNEQSEADENNSNSKIIESSVEHPPTNVDEFISFISHILGLSGASDILVLFHRIHSYLTSMTQRVFEISVALITFVYLTTNFIIEMFSLTDPVILRNTLFISRVVSETGNVFYTLVADGLRFFSGTRGDAFGSTAATTGLNAYCGFVKSQWQRLWQKFKFAWNEAIEIIELDSKKFNEALPLIAKYFAQTREPLKILVPFWWLGLWSTLESKWTIPAFN